MKFVITLFFLIFINPYKSDIFAQTGADLYRIRYQYPNKIVREYWMSIPPNGSIVIVAPHEGDGTLDPCWGFDLNPNYGLHVKVLDAEYAYRYPEMFFYADTSQPMIGGTNQYCGATVQISCVPRRTLYQPTTWIPIDIDNVHPDADCKGRFPIRPPIGTNGRMMLLRRAFFWENSEDVWGIHGPYGDIKINVCDPGILNYSYKQLQDDPSLWNKEGIRYYCCVLPGPVWEANNYPEPHNEWLDGPWGCYYSNIGFFDWEKNKNYTTVAIVISESGDDPEDFLGAMRIHRDSLGIHRMMVRMFGWIEFEVKNINEPENSVDIADIYWHGTYPGHWPYAEYLDEVIGPEGHLDGSQYTPYPSSKFFSNYPALKGKTIGLLGGKFPAGTYNIPMTFISIGQPAIFGK